MIKKSEETFPKYAIIAFPKMGRSLLMTHNIAKSAVERTSKMLLDKVFANFGKVARESARTLFSAVVRTGSALVTDLAASMERDATSKKGRQEKVSGWLGRYDYASPVCDHLWDEGVALISRDTIIAIDSGDISKEFGGKGMEGMEMGYDASRGVTAMGHSLLCAAVVVRKRAVPLQLSLLKGRKGLPDAEINLFDKIIASTGDKGIIVQDRGFDSERFVSHAIQSAHRSVVRIKEMTRDVFGTGRSIDKDMMDAPCVYAILRSPTRQVKAEVRWRKGFFPYKNSHLEILVVSSTFNGATLYLYALNFLRQNASMKELSEAAILAANAYFCRWSVEVLFQDIKQCFRIEDARVRTFCRLKSLLALCTLAYTYFAHVLPRCEDETKRLLKTMKDSLGEIIESFRTFVANVRELLRMERTRFISGRPRKHKPPDMAPYLPGLEP